MPPGKPGQTANILIVDDDELVRDFSVHTIEYGTNRKVVTYASGFKAWQYIQNHAQDVDIIIADANIPDMDGFELLGRVKPEMPDKIFIITSSDPALEKTANKLGADAFVSKPFDARDLFVIVQRFVLGSESAAQQKVTPINNTPSPNETSEA